MQNAERLLTSNEAAAVFGLRVATLARWRWIGKGPRWIKVGGAVRYDPAELRRWIAAQTRCSTSDPSREWHDTRPDGAQRNRVPTSTTA
jgi:predicted DNA-binding transcriptional regulator AlpA